MSRPSRVQVEQVLGIDPGPSLSGYVEFDGTRVRDAGVVDNGSLLLWLQTKMYGPETAVVIERIVGMGQMVGRTTFETAFWSGRFYEAAYAANCAVIARVPRTDVKMWLCGKTSVKDKDVRAALLTRFGNPPRGTAAKPGPLYAVTSHAWAALAVAVTWWDKTGIARHDTQMRADVTPY